MSAAARPFAAVAVAIALALLAVQLLADGLFGSLAAPHSLPHHLAGDWPFKVLARTGIDRIAPVRVALARAAIVRNEPDRALTLLDGLATSHETDDLRGQAALAAHDPKTALHYFAAAGDFIAASATIDVVSSSDPRAALVIVRDFERQLSERSSAPEIAAEVAWREGVIAAYAAALFPAEALAFQHQAFDAFGRALDSAPNDEKYLLNYAFTALKLDDVTTARANYVRAAQVVPDSVDAFVGVALTNAVLGECVPARAALVRANELAEIQHRLVDPAAAGYTSPVRAALTRCGG